MSLKIWWPFLVIFFVAGLIFRLETMIYLPPAIFFLIVVTTLWNRISLKDISYLRKWVYRRGFVGEEIPLSLEIRNDKPLPLLWLQTRDMWPRAIGPLDGNALIISHKPELGYINNYFNLKWFASQKRFYTLKMRARGYYRVGPVTVNSGDFFSLTENQKVFDQTEIVVVYPRIQDIPNLTILTRNPIGTRPARRQLMQDHSLPYGIRDYQPDDEFKYIHWNATAHTGTLQTRLYQPVTSRTMMVCLNGTTTEDSLGGYYAEVLENLVSLAASVVYQAHRDGYSVGLLSNSGLVGGGRPFHIDPARTTLHLSRILEALAALQPITFNRFDNYIMREVHSIPYGASLVLMTSIIPTELVMAMMKLRKFHPNVTLISTYPSPPPEIPGVQTVHWPFVYHEKQPASFTSQTESLQVDDG